MSVEIRGETKNLDNSWNSSWDALQRGRSIPDTLVGSQWRHQPSVTTSNAGSLFQSRIPRKTDENETKKDRNRSDFHSTNSLEMTSPSLAKVMRVRGTDVVGLRTSKFGDGTDPREIPFEEGKPRRRSRSSRKRETRAPSIGFFFVRRGEGGASYLSLATDDKKRNGRRKKTETVSRTGGAACARRRHVERRLTRWPGTASTFYRATSGEKKTSFLCVEIHISFRFDREQRSRWSVRSSTHLVDLQISPAFRWRLNNLFFLIENGALMGWVAVFFSCHDQ